jgi:hypothetical protein
MRGLRKQLPYYLGAQGEPSGAAFMPNVKVTSEMATAAVTEVDWVATDAMTDADIARQVAENPDAAPLLTKRNTNGGDRR